MITHPEHTTDELLQDLADQAEQLAAAAAELKEHAQAAQRPSQSAVWLIVEAIQAMRVQAAELEDLAMHTANACGISWADLGRFRSITRQAAAKKWSADAIKRKYWTGYHEATPEPAYVELAPGAYSFEG
jgi:hypothetical protein